MLSITLDLGNLPSVLAAMSHPANAQRTANAMAERYVTEVHDFIDAGRGFTPRTGQLQQSINWRPKGNGGAEVYANADYASFVERGTEAHVIRPRDRQALRFPVGFGFAFARVINHPGSRPQPFLLVDLEHRKDALQEAGMLMLAEIMADAE